MKKLLILFAAAMMAGSLMAQDIIVTNDAKKIDAKILEVTESEIRYKEADNLAGPVHTLGINRLVTIIYANGKVVLYNQPSQQPVAPSVAEQKGRPVGYGAGAHNWSLAGRNLRGPLPRPSNKFYQEGMVIVLIRVNAAGDVIDATIKGGSISDKRTQQLALDAAKQAKFTAGTQEQIGTITYIFKFND